MHEIQVSYRGDDQGLKCAGGKSLDDACGKEVVVADLRLTDCRSNDIKEGRGDKAWAFAVLATEGAEYRTRAASSQ